MQSQIMKIIHALLLLMSFLQVSHKKDNSGSGAKQLGYCLQTCRILNRALFSGASGDKSTDTNTKVMPCLWATALCHLLAISERGKNITTYSFCWLLKLYISTTGNAAKHYTAAQLIPDFHYKPTKRWISNKSAECKTCTLANKIRHQINS